MMNNSLSKLYTKNASYLLADCGFKIRTCTEIMKDKRREGCVVKH